MLTITTARRFRRALAGLALALAATVARADSYSFDGGAVAGCTRSGTTYACASLPLSNWNDSMTIASGYTVNVGSSIAVGYNQTLTMSGTARLTTTGSLNIADVAKSNLQISGGSLAAGGAFSCGNQQQKITADVSAASMTIGGGSKISIDGNLTSTGTVALASNADVNGNISGTTITTGTPVSITGNITATTSFTLSSEGTVVGNITAPVVTLDAAKSKVTGNITAASSLSLGSEDLVTGTVKAGTLTLYSSNAIIKGNATVTSATLGWNGRVTGSIYCSAGNTAGNCDCVINNSGNAVNTASGPNCPATGTSGPDHYLISHPASGLTCTPATVTVKACANASCSTLYGGKPTMVLAPTNQSVSMEADGENQVALSITNDGVSTLSTASGNYSCLNTDNGNTDCKITFNKAGFVLSAADHVAGSGTDLTVRAVKESNSATSCAPAFTGTRSVTFNCGYTDPASGSQAVSIGNASCGGAVSLNFDSTGTATTRFSYDDTGKVNVKASQSGPSMEGSTTIVTGPSRFGFTNTVYDNPLDPAQPNKNPKAGAVFTATLTAYNSKNVQTANFGKETSPPSVQLSHVLCNTPGGDPGGLTPATTKFTGGKSSPGMAWTEVGSINVTATLAANYMGSTLGQVSSSSGCVYGPFVPAYFDLAASDAARTINYSGEAVALNVTAKNSNGSKTLNYSNNTGLAKAVTFSVVDKALGTLNPGPGATTAAALAASAFTDGVASSGVPVYTYTNVKTTPATVLFRATDSDGVSSKGHTEVTRAVRSGRLRIYNRFGNAKGTLELPVTAEFWTGSSWALNTEDLTPVTILATAVALSPATGLIMDAPENFTINKGQGKLKLKPASGTGSVDVAVNLGSDNKDTACLGAHPASTGAARAYLRSNNGSCAATFSSDPSARATFGVFSPETKRIIHMREVFR